MDEKTPTPDAGPSVKVQPNGPYIVSGDIELRHKAPVETEAGDPIAWRVEDDIEAGSKYSLCRCGGSANKPFCDGTHAKIGFDGTETAPTNTYAERAKTYPAGEVTVHDDRQLCVHAGFCGNTQTDVWKMTHSPDDPTVLGHMVDMIEHCPSGALTYEIDGHVIEPDLPVAANVIPDGPLWFTGGVPVTRSDGEPFETRNRVTLCRCGASKNKPLCDGTHKEIGFTG